MYSINTFNAIADYLVVVVATIGKCRFLAFFFSHPRITDIDVEEIVCVAYLAR